MKYSYHLVPECVDSCSNHIFGHDHNSRFVGTLTMTMHKTFISVWIKLFPNNLYQKVLENHVTRQVVQYQQNIYSVCYLCDQKLELLAKPDVISNNTILFKNNTITQKGQLIGITLKYVFSDYYMNSILPVSDQIYTLKVTILGQCLLCQRIYISINLDL